MLSASFRGGNTKMHSLELTFPSNQVCLVQTDAVYF